MFSMTQKVRMYDTDAAQLLFFGNQFRFINDVFEEFLEAIGYPTQSMFQSDFAVLFVHAQSDYLAPLCVGDVIEITLQVTEIGTSSFTVSYKIARKCDACMVGKGKSVHVVVDKQTKKKTAKIGRAHV